MAGRNQRGDAAALQHSHGFTLAEEPTRRGALEDALRLGTHCRRTERVEQQRYVRHTARAQLVGTVLSSRRVHSCSSGSLRLLQAQHSVPRQCTQPLFVCAARMQTPSNQVRAVDRGTSSSAPGKIARLDSWRWLLQVARKWRGQDIATRSFPSASFSQCAHLCIGCVLFAVAGAAVRIDVSQQS